eukprot:1703592-Pleurochrysis_carterae.AAC.3
MRTSVDLGRWSQLADARIVRFACYRRTECGVLARLGGRASALNAVERLVEVLLDVGALDVAHVAPDVLHSRLVHALLQRHRRVGERRHLRRRRATRYAACQVGANHG